MTNKNLLASLVILFSLMLGFSGCGKSSSSDADKPGGPAAGRADDLSPIEREARDAVVAEIQKRWIKKSDGWVTARVGGSAYSPEHFLAQARELTLHHVEPVDLDNSDKMNGIEWAGKVQLNKTPLREIGESGVALEGTNAGFSTRQPGVWTQWTDWLPDAVSVQKVKGKWEINTDTKLLRGTMPTPSDLAKWGVK